MLYQGIRLHWEAKRGHKGKVKSLIENGTNVDIKDSEGVSTLWCYKSIYLGCYSYSLTPNTWKRVQCTVSINDIFCCCWKNRVSIIKALKLLLLPTKPSIQLPSVWERWVPLPTLKLNFFYQRTPLHIAAGEGHDSTVKYLVENKADVNSQDNTGVSIWLL